MRDGAALDNKLTNVRDCLTNFNYLNSIIFQHISNGLSLTKILNFFLPCKTLLIVKEPVLVAVSLEYFQKYAM